MDRLSEIRARCEAAKTEKGKGNAIDCACLSWAIVLNDIPYLLEEIERLHGLLAERNVLLDKYEAGNRWIPVSERLPEHEREAVLAYQRDFNEAHIAWISGGYWEDTSGTFAPGKITHWRPLPESPKGE